MEIRFADESDAAKCNEFYNDYYQSERTLEQWRWEFLDYTQISSLPFVVVSENDEIVATQAFINIPLIDEKGVFWTAKSEETLVSPKMRGKKLFEKMYEPLFSLLKRERWCSVWGFTPAVKSFERVGFKVPVSTKQLFRVFSPKAVTNMPVIKDKNKFYKCLVGLATVGLLLKGRLQELFITTPMDEDEEVRPISSASEISGALSEAFIKRWGGTTIHRDSEFMDWRIFRNPYCKCSVLGFYKEGKLLAFLVSSIDEGGSGYFVDIISAHTDGKAGDIRAVNALISKGVKELRLKGAHSVRAWSVTDHPFDQLVQDAACKRGFRKISLGSPAVFYVEPAIGMRETSHDDFNRWYVTRLFTQGAQG